MKDLNTSILCVTICLLSMNSCLSFTTQQQILSNNQISRNNRNRNTRLNAGGWGKRKKDFVDDEFARTDGTRRGFEKYELQERGDFLRSVNSSREKFLKKKDEEYLAIAKMAGVTDQSGDGIEPMGEFDVDDDDLFDDIDVSVQWDEDDLDEDEMGPVVKYDPDTSITRLDNDLDVAGRTGQW